MTKQALGISVTTIVVLLSAPTVRSNAQGDAKSLRETYQEAQQLAKNPETLPQAIAKYQAVLETHMANQETFRAALKELIQCYEQSGQTEAGLRYFRLLLKQMEAAEFRDYSRRDILQFQERNRELAAKVYRDLAGIGGVRRQFQGVRPAADLAESILQRRDKTLREKSLAKLREMLAPAASETSKHRALATLQASLSAKFDRKSFLPLVLPLLESEDAAIRGFALRCLPGLGATAQDLPRIAALADDPSPQVRSQVGFALVAIGKGQHADVVIPALMRLLTDEEPQVIDQTVRSMWGEYSSPELDELLIRLSRQPRYHHNVIYFCLSPMRSKSVAVCRRLVEELDDPDWNNSGRAAWGLTFGISDEAKGLVEDGLLKALPEETNPYTRRQEFRALRRVATEKSRPYLKSVIESDTESAPFQRLALQVLSELKTRR